MAVLAEHGTPRFAWSGFAPILAVHFLGTLGLRNCPTRGLWLLLLAPLLPAQRLVRDLEPGPGDSWPAAIGSFPDFAVAGDALYFFASAPEPTFWRTDGTTTVPLRTFPSAVFFWGPYGTSLGNELYFQFDDGVIGWELWRTDGTPGGTVPIDSNPGPGGFAPGGLQGVAGTDLLPRQQRAPWR
ncbi:MAG: hypothetical protein AAF628_36285 [Planctomycetota bacterium]